MGERIGNSFRSVIAAACALAVLAAGGAFALLARGEIVNGALVAAVTYFLFRLFWRSTRRRRELLGRGYFIGRRVGTHWIYEELRDGEIVGLELPLEYVGRGEYDIHVPGERDWLARAPDWARARREEIIERLLAVFKRSQLHVDPDSAQAPPAQG
jgi:hypothetical protein